MSTIAKTVRKASARFQPLRSDHDAVAVVPERWQERYLKMLPEICRLAHIQARHLRGEARADAVQEMVADTVVAYARLASLGKENLAYVSPLVHYAKSKLQAGRRVGNRLNVRDVLSTYCQQRKGIVVERLDRVNERAGQWNEILVEDRRASPADLAAIRIDFCEWIKTLPANRRRAAALLALGETTSAVAEKLRVSSGRVSQIRKALCDSWELFTGESWERRRSAPTCSIRSRKLSKRR
jgi:hypothetical protein